MVYGIVYEREETKERVLTTDRERHRYCGAEVIDFQETTLNGQPVNILWLESSRLRFWINKIRYHWNDLGLQR